MRFLGENLDAVANDDVGVIVAVRGDLPSPSEALQAQHDIEALGALYVGLC